MKSLLRWLNQHTLVTMAVVLFLYFFGPMVAYTAVHRSEERTVTVNGQTRQVWIEWQNGLVQMGTGLIAHTLYAKDGTVYKRMLIPPSRFAPQYVILPETPTPDEVALYKSLFS